MYKCFQQWNKLRAYDGYCQRDLLFSIRKSPPMDPTDGLLFQDLVSRTLEVRGFLKRSDVCSALRYLNVVFKGQVLAVHRFGSVLPTAPPCGNGFVVFQNALCATEALYTTPLAILSPRGRPYRLRFTQCPRTWSNRLELKQNQLAGGAA